MVAAGHHSRLDAFLPQLEQKVVYAGDIVEAHVGFEIVQCCGDTLLQRGLTREILVVNLHQRHAFDAVVEVGNIGLKLSPLVLPKLRVKWFGIENDTI